MRRPKKRRAKKETRGVRIDVPDPSNLPRIRAMIREEAARLGVDIVGWEEEGPGAEPQPEGKATT